MLILIANCSILQVRLHQRIIYKVIFNVQKLPILEYLKEMIVRQTYSLSFFVLFCFFWKADSLAEVHVKPFKKTSCLHQQQCKGHVGIPVSFQRQFKLSSYILKIQRSHCGQPTESASVVVVWTVMHGYQKRIEPVVVNSQIGEPCCMEKKKPYLQYILVNREVPLYLIFIRFYNNLIKHSKFWHN